MYLQPHSKHLCWTEPNPCSQQTMELPGPSRSRFPGSKRGGFPSCHPVPAFPLPLLSRSPSRGGNCPGVMGLEQHLPARLLPQCGEGTKQGQDCWKQPTSTEHTCVQTPQSRGGSSEPQCHELHDGCGRATAPSPHAGGERALWVGEFTLAKKTFRLF